MSLLTAPCLRVSLIAVSIAAVGLSGCVTPAGLGVVDGLASGAPHSATAAPEVDLLRAFAEAKESLVESSERSVLKSRASAKPAAFTVTQIEAAAPPAGLDRQPSPELLPINPPRAEPNSAATSADQPTGGQPGTQQRIKSIREISLDIRAPQLFNDQQQAMPAPPDEGATALPLLAEAQPFTRGDLANSGFHWQPTVEGLTFCYQPLYFQEVNVERYGRSFGMFQPVVSVASFYGRVPLLPYMAFARPARRCTCPPHWTLPGYRIPEWERHEFVPSLSGGAAEVAAVAGIILLIP